MGEGGPLFLNLEAGILIKREFVEKNNIAPYGIVCKINTQNYFWIFGSLKRGGFGGGTDVLEKFTNNIVCCLTDYLS